MSGIPGTKQKVMFHRFIVNATLAIRRCTTVNFIQIFSKTGKTKSKAGVIDRCTPRKKRNQITYYKYG